MPFFFLFFFLGVGTAWSDGVASRGSSWLLLSNLTPQVRREYRKWNSSLQKTNYLFSKTTKWWWMKNEGLLNQNILNLSCHSSVFSNMTRQQKDYRACFNWIVKLDKPFNQIWFSQFIFPKLTVTMTFVRLFFFSLSTYPNQVYSLIPSSSFPIDWWLHT